MPAEPDPYFFENQQLASPELNRLRPEARYVRDPLFKSLVDSLYNLIRAGDMTPTEVREAALFAATRYETLHVTPILFPTRTV